MRIPTARFEVEVVFEMPSRHAIVLGGNILAGKIKSGMQVKVATNSELYLVADISVVEMILKTGGREIIGIVLNMPEPETRALWMGLSIQGDIISIESADVQTWPFDQPPDSAVFTTAQVLADGYPITYVFHDLDDHGWQFHHAGEKLNTDARVVALREIVEIDPSVLEVADISPGWMAYRKDQKSLWERKENQKNKEQYRFH